MIVCNLILRPLELMTREFSTSENSGKLFCRVCNMIVIHVTLTKSTKKTETTKNSD